MKNKKIIIIAGPTAVGKTALSVSLAKRINGEIISADSMQIYKQMDIGTAKVTASESSGITHHMIDIVSPQDDFTVADYANLAREKIDDILSKGKVPIIVGGTGLYINSIVFVVVDMLMYQTELQTCHIIKLLLKIKRFLHWVHLHPATLLQ